MQKREQKENGFTFIEVMVSMVISSFIFAGIYGVYSIQQRSYTVQEQVSEMQQKGRAALAFMVRDIRMAAYNDPDGNCTSGSSTNWSNWNAQSTTFSFDTCLPGDTAPVKVEYGLYDAYAVSGGNDGLDNDLYRSIDGGNKQLVAEGLDAVEFHYILDEVPANPGVYPTATSVTVAADIERIRSVRISLLMRSTYPDIKYTDEVQHIPASGATNWGIISKAATPGTLLLPWYNYHRRLLITTVKMRNMGL
ncbi:MAG: prepilin-type N-terminal cleavage/methylation domain-containing protein [Candidatus Electrothrix sp. AR5]|nr:prepilin-type N-terminal cleavage/methylation domain-containing protein [Candidatus Electrothrix sp. AR5]